MIPCRTCLPLLKTGLCGEICQPLLFSCSPWWSVWADKHVCQQVSVNKWVNKPMCRPDLTCLPSIWVLFWDLRQQPRKKYKFVCRKNQLQNTKKWAKWAFYILKDMNKQMLSFIKMYNKCNKWKKHYKEKTIMTKKVKQKLFFSD